MVRIVARTVGMRLLDDAVLKFVPHHSALQVNEDAGARGPRMEIMEVDGFDVCVGVREDGRAYAESPCGAAG